MNCFNLSIIKKEDFQIVRFSNCEIFKMCDFRENRTFWKSHLLKISQFEDLTIWKEHFFIIERLKQFIWLGFSMQICLLRCLSVKAWDHQCVLKFKYVWISFERGSAFLEKIWNSKILQYPIKGPQMGESCEG